MNEKDSSQLLKLLIVAIIYMYFTNSFICSKVQLEYVSYEDGLGVFLCAWLGFGVLTSCRLSNFQSLVR
ncbi:hypothetical protein KGR20_05550 [Cytobacillus oceanisediminis]|nr:hypothetical protein [Cytobacillus oceanisediminis]